MLQVKLFVELFSSKYQSLFFKLLRAGSDDEVNELAKQLEHNLEVYSTRLTAFASTIPTLLAGFCHDSNLCAPASGH